MQLNCLLEEPREKFGLLAKLFARIATVLEIVGSQVFGGFKVAFRVGVKFERMCNNGLESLVLFRAAHMV